jgi:tetratricopeptide (TPR) repeat protein
MKKIGGLRSLGWLPLVMMGLLLFFTELSFSQSNELFEKGKQLYKAEKYQEALNNWMKIEAAGEHSAALYYNIANANYRLNSIGPSIYYYEKALELAPGDREILNNLAFAQNATIDAIEPLPKTIFAQWDATLSSWLTFDGWAWVTVSCAFLFAVLFLLYFFSNHTLRKRLLFVGSIASFVVLLIGLTMSFRTYNRQLNDQPAIIFAESTDIKTDPSKKSETVFILHEGTKVQIIAKDEDWYRIVIADGKDGWIPGTDLKAL